MTHPRPLLSPRLIDMAGSFAKQSGLLMSTVISMVGILVDTVECSYNGFWKGYGHRQDCHVHIFLKEALRITAGQEHRSIANLWSKF